MKIIGEAEGGAMLISATKDELANLVGFYYAGSAACPDFKPGMKIEIAGMFNQLHELGRKKEMLGKLAAELRILASHMELRNPIVAEATQPAKAE